jgi:hypothetical protein
LAATFSSFRNEESLKIDIQVTEFTP